MSIAPDMVLAPSRRASKSPRVSWLDTFRGLSIAMVVLGHVLGGLAFADFVREADHRALRHAYDFLYTFRIPALMVASGLFAGRSLRRGLSSFLGDKSRTLAYPYLVWSLIGWACHGLASGATNSEVDPLTPLKMLYDPMHGVWFLYVLFVVMVGYGIWSDRGGDRWGFLAMGLVLRVLVPCWEAAPSLLAQVSESAVYFGVGLVLADPIRTLGDRLPRRSVLGLVLISFAVMKGAVALRIETHPCFGIIPALCGTSGMFGVAMLLDRLPGVEFLRYCGRHSLQIYVAGGFGSVATRILLRGLGVSALSVHIALGTVAGLLLPLALVAICQAVGFRHLFAWPKPATSDRARVGEWDQDLSEGRFTRPTSWEASPSTFSRRPCFLPGENAWERRAERETMVQGSI